jgi:hypothetical protein
LGNDVIRRFLHTAAAIMPTRKHLTDQSAFGPAAIEAMSKAFEEACNALQVFAGDEKGREVTGARRCN